jgi:membrane protease YdiL (CAAX protease family)
MYGTLIAFFVCIALVQFSLSIQGALRRTFEKRPKVLWAVPALLLIFLCLFLSSNRILTLPLVLLAGSFVITPTVLSYINGPGSGPHRHTYSTPWLDLSAILALWLPLEFGVGKALVPERFHGSAHAIAYGIAVTLGLVLFLEYRQLPGMKYQLPRAWRDLANPLAGLAIAVPVLSNLAQKLHFIGSFHVPPDFSLSSFGLRYLTIFLGVALPEELLFRSLIQNWIMQQYGWNWKSLSIASLVFGAAHLNNAPGGFPNWRYMSLATVAGLIYGKVFQTSSSIVCSAGLHAAVNTLRHTFY